MKKHLHPFVDVYYISVVIFHFDQLFCNYMLLVCTLCDISLRGDLWVGFIGWTTKNFMHTVVTSAQLNTTLPG